MKMLQINAVNNIGSTGRTTKEIADYFNEKGHSSFIAYSEGDHYKYEYKFKSYIEKKIHALLSRILGIQGYFSKRETRELIKYIKKNNIDVVRLGNLHSNFINIPLLLKFLGENDIPTIITLDDCFYFTGKCTHYTEDKCNKWKTGCYKCIRKDKDNPSWFLDRSNKMWNDKRKLYDNIPRLAVIGVSNWITNEARQSILSTANYITTIYNWIDTDKFKPIDVKEIKKQMALENKFLILGVATEWGNSKGLDRFIELADIIEEDELIVLVGKIDIDICLPKNIIHINQTDNVDELIKYYCMADVFLQLSKEETFGKVVAEALSCGTPVVALNSTANPELVDKRCGYVADEDSIKDKIISIRKNGKNFYSKNCRQFAIKNFNKEDRINDYIQLCKKLIDLKV